MPSAENLVETEKVWAVFLLTFSLPAGWVWLQVVQQLSGLCHSHYWIRDGLLSYRAYYEPAPFAIRGDCF